MILHDFIYCQSKRSKSVNKFNTSPASNNDYGVIYFIKQ